MLTPTFHFKILEDAMNSLVKNAQSLTEQFLAAEGMPVDVGDIIRSSTLKVICGNFIRLFTINTTNELNFVQISKMLLEFLIVIYS